MDGVGGVTRALKTKWQLALDWFVASYPLLGAIADAFTLVEDAEVCRTHGIRIAAISPVAAELYVNPRYGLTGGERRRSFRSSVTTRAGGEPGCASACLAAR